MKPTKEIKALVTRQVIQAEGPYVHDMPTFEQLEKALGRDRIAKIAILDIERHHVNPAVKAARDIVKNGSKLKTDEAKAKELAEATALVDSIVAGTVLSILDYVPTERAEVNPNAKLAETHGKLKAAGKHDEAKAFKAALTPEVRNAFNAYLLEMAAD